MKFKQVIEKVIYVNKELDEIKSIFKSFENKTNEKNIENNLGLINDKLKKYDIEMYISRNAIIKFKTDEFINGFLHTWLDNIQVVLPGNYYELSGRNHIKLFKLILNVIEHELIHREQKYRGSELLANENIPQKKYLSSPLEIMTFAKNAVNYLKMKYTNDKILKAMRNFKGDKNNILSDSEVVVKYFEHFYNDKDQKVWRRFIKYMYQYLET